MLASGFLIHYKDQLVIDIIRFLIKLWMVATLK